MSVAKAVKVTNCSKIGSLSMHEETEAQVHRVFQYTMASQICLQVTLNMTIIIIISMNYGAL